ncbi:MAG: hypothetical protein JJ850_09395 [Kordiimonadaceae bacterium]|nr:hypothetical protein [Kordiimonadaceae bacterium]MBO6569345.1 hypothetical protein [Kordiimonadaceae bacterium]MBO6964820.1 hypothetical protein [Kordiimonadaceae bacterium]
MQPIDRTFGEHFLTCVEDFSNYGVHLLFNEWWASAPQSVIDQYVDAIENHPEQGPLARAGWLEPSFDIGRVEACEPGTLGAAYREFMTTHDLAEKLAEGYRELHEDVKGTGKLSRMPDTLQYKILRGYQTHDIHHVLTGYPPTPFGELALQAFGLAQTQYPYAGMWMAVATAHMTFVDPSLMNGAMDAICDGWTRGKATRSIQFVVFESMFDRPLADVREEFAVNPTSMRN